MEGTCATTASIWATTCGSIDGGASEPPGDPGADGEAEAPALAVGAAEGEGRVDGDVVALGAAAVGVALGASDERAVGLPPANAEGPADALGFRPDSSRYHAAAPATVATAKSSTRMPTSAPGPRRRGGSEPGGGKPPGGGDQGGWYCGCG
jgi:hypothetical protein